jgi:hypothetical protein
MSHPPAVHLTTHMKTKATTKKKPPAVTRENGRPTINAEAVDDLFEQTIANLAPSWQKINAEAIDNLFVRNHRQPHSPPNVWEKISLKEELQ